VNKEIVSLDNNRLATRIKPQDGVPKVEKNPIAVTPPTGSVTPPTGGIAPPSGTPFAGDLNTSHMNKQHQNFYDKNPSFKGTDKEIVSFGDRKLATRVSPAGGVPKVEKKPIGYVPPQQGVKEGGNKYKIKSTGSDINPATKNREDYFISPSTGKKVYKKAKVGDHENPNSGEHKPKVEGRFARAIMKEFGLK
jgi:hypothetical protein